MLDCGGATNSCFFWINTWIFRPLGPCPTGTTCRQWLADHQPEERKQVPWNRIDWRFGGYHLVISHSCGKSPCLMEKMAVKSDFPLLCWITRGYTYWILHSRFWRPRMVDFNCMMLVENQLPPMDAWSLPVKVLHLPNYSPAKKVLGSPGNQNYQQRKSLVYVLFYRDRTSSYANFAGSLRLSVLFFKFTFC